MKHRAQELNPQGGLQNAGKEESQEGCKKEKEIVVRGARSPLKGK